MNSLLAVRWLVIWVCCYSISACQSSFLGINNEADFSRNQSVSIELKSTPYSDYYGWLKGLNIEQLQQEIKIQEKLQEQSDPDASMHLILLYSLPHSPVKNPHRARKELEQQMLDNSELSEIRWLAVFYDSLVEQVQLLNKISNMIDQQFFENELNEAEIDLLILELDTQKQENTILQYQLNQLRKIEKAISKREQ